MEDVKPVVGMKRPLVEEYDSEEEVEQKASVKGTLPLSFRKIKARLAFSRYKPV